MVGNCDCATTGGRVKFAAECQAVYHVDKFHNAFAVGKNRNVVRVPARELRALLDSLAVSRSYPRARHYCVVFKLLAVVVEDQDVASLIEHYITLDFLAARRIEMRKLDCAKVAVRDNAVVADCYFRRFYGLGNTADVEGSHRKLSAGLANGLRRNNADSRSALDELLRRGVYAVRLCGNRVALQVRERAHYLYALYSKRIDFLCHSLGNKLAAMDYDFARVCRIGDVVARAAANYAVKERHYFVVAVVYSLFPDAVCVVVVLFGDDYVHRNVAQLSGHVAGVGRFKGGVGEPLAGAVRGNEIFVHAQSFAEGRQNRAFDNFAVGPSNRGLRRAGEPAPCCRAPRNP